MRPSFCGWGQGGNISDPTLMLEAQSVQYRHRFLQFLAILGLGVALVISAFQFLWNKPVVVASCLVYAVACIATILILRRRPEKTGLLTNNFIFCSLVITLVGIYYQTPEAVVDPWILTCPVVAYALCHKQIAARWTAFTLFCLFVLRHFQLHAVALPSTILLALCVLAMCMVLHLFSSQIEKNEHVIVKIGNTDPLTNTLNRRSFPDVLQSEFRRNLRQKMSMTVIMVDVDHFKSYNDRYGHVAGDKTLSVVANVLNETARRSGDFVFRYGGEEFCILCPGLDEDQAPRFCEQLRANVEAIGCEHLGSPIGRISVSVGYRHAATVDMLVAEELVEHADKALYLAKANGRNQVSRYQPDDTSIAA